MKLKTIFLTAFLFVATNSIAQNSNNEINSKDGVRYITTSINYPVAGIYTFKGGEPIVELNSNGTGFYQLHDQPKRAMTWGFECDKEGALKFTKGYDSTEYIMYYKFTSPSEHGAEEQWNKVEFSIHFNSLKMFINGERVKSFIYKEEN
ncbi:MAG: hypothetical protein JNJ52_10885 [Flavobacterium sp.]|nr:hypothetical protein [Flavobacterium sp.]